MSGNRRATQGAPRKLGTDPLKILHIINYLRIGGAEALLLSDVLAQRALGHEVEVQVLESGHAVMEQRYAVAGVVVRRLAAPRYRSIPEFLRLVRRERWDVCHTHLYPAMLYGILAKVCGAARCLVHTEHNTSNNRRKSYLWALDASLYIPFDCVVCISEGVRQALIAWVPFMANRTRTILNAVTPKQLRDPMRPPARPLRLLTVGRLVKDKNHELQLRLLARISAVTLDIVGEGPLLAQLQHKATELGADDRVAFLGPCADMETLYQAYDAYIHTASLEGFGMVVAEAMTAGLPVIAPCVAGLNEVVGESGLLFEPDNLDDLQHQIEHLLSLNAESYAALCRQSRERAQLFDIQLHVEALNRVYAEFA